MMERKNAADKPLTRWGLFTRFPAWTVSTALCALAVTVGNVLVRRQLGELIDTIGIGGESGQRFTVVVLLLALLLIASPLAGFLRERLGGKISAHLYRLLNDKGLAMTQTAADTLGAGMLTTAFTRDVNACKQFMDRMLDRFVPDVLTLALTVGLFFALSPLLGLVAVVAAAVPVGAMQLFGLQVFAGTKAYQETLEQVNQGIASGVGNLEAIKAAGLEARFAREDRERLTVLQGKKRRVAAWEAMLGAPALLSSFVTLLALLVTGGILVLRGSLTLGALFTVVTLSDFVISPVMRMDGSLAAMKRAQASVQRLNRLLEQPSESVDPEQRLPEPIFEIALDQVSFAYLSAPETQVLFDFSQTWRPGRLHLLKGDNGKGKSTLFKLLSGVYPVGSGQIRVNGKPLDERGLRALRSRVTVVSQEHPLFSGTIRENLTGGLKDVTEAEMIEACRRLGIHEEIVALPQGYDTLLQEDGSPLSGGQRQRISLARAFLRKGEVLLLDEPTAAIDPAHKALLGELVREAAREQIVVVITHDPFWDDFDQSVTILGQEVEA